VTETYTSGTWVVKPGEEDAFVQEWTGFVTWACGMPGSSSFRLVRDLDQPRHYMSFAPWESFEAQQAWTQLGTGCSTPPRASEQASERVRGALA
jgi:heme-degrading monooxygenase HmoA